jgi:hypothetical protein
MHVADRTQVLADSLRPKRSRLCQDLHLIFSMNTSRSLHRRRGGTPTTLRKSHHKVRTGPRSRLRRACPPGQRWRVLCRTSASSRSLASTKNQDADVALTNTSSGSCPTYLGTPRLAAEALWNRARPIEGAQRRCYRRQITQTRPVCSASLRAAFLRDHLLDRDEQAASAALAPGS